MLRYSRFITLFTVLMIALFSLSGKFIEDSEESRLTDTEKLYGLSLIWSEAKYNFVFFDQVPELDWDAAYKEYITKVLATENMIDYYRTMNQFMALLSDGHTDARMPQEEFAKLDQPAIRVREIDGKAVVVAIERSFLDQIPLGSLVLSVDGAETLQYAKEHVIPYVAASTDHVRLDLALLGRNSRGWGLLVREKGSKVKLLVRNPEGVEKTVELTCDRNGREIDWVRLPRPEGLVDWRWLEEGIAYVALNSFNDPKIVDEFKTILPEIKSAKGFVIDLRFNGGGNTNNGTAILAHFTDKDLEGSTWRTKEHRGAYYAWAMRDKEHRFHDTYGTLNAWYQGGAMTMKAGEGEKMLVPVVVLIDYDTFSAAEDFLIFADQLEQFTFVGRPSNGSTGQPIFYEMPGGGGARICAKRDTYADGRDFVGVGVQPDVYVAPTIEGIAKGTDIILLKGLEVLKSKIEN